MNDAKIIKLEKLALPLTGAGRLLMLEQCLTLSKALDLLKNHLGLSHLRLAIANSASMGKILTTILQLKNSMASARTLTQSLQLIY